MTDDTYYINGGGIHSEPGDGPRDEEVEVCRAFLEKFCEPSDERTESSYQMKHIIERWAPNAGYVSNGALIKAADELGYAYDVRRGGPNADIYMDPDGFCQMKRQERGIEEMYRALERFVEDSQSVLDMLSRPKSFFDLDGQGQVRGEGHLKGAASAARNVAAKLECYRAKGIARDGKLYRCTETFQFSVRADSYYRSHGGSGKRIVYVEAGDCFWLNSQRRAIAGLHHPKGVGLGSLKRPEEGVSVDSVIEDRCERPIDAGEYDVRFQLEGAAWRVEIDHENWGEPDYEPPKDLRPADDLDALCDEVEAQLGIDGADD
jgi:hypothetical protein